MSGTYRLLLITPSKVVTAARRLRWVNTRGQQESLGSERGLATPSPDGRGEITLSPSIKIMPVKS
jgi:hypothetical protein